MEAGNLPQVHKLPQDSFGGTLGAAVDATCDLGLALQANDAQGTWKHHAPTAAERELSDELQVVVALRLSYRGEPFSGFAKQPGQLTVQGSLEEALGKVFRHPVETVCAGRTDSGVHARGQWVSFSLTGKEWNERSEYKILKSLNALTHEDISVREIVRKDLDFSARFSARSREYRYFICTDQARPLLMRDFSWHLGKPLDLEAMRKAASYLIGEHDFRSFCMAASAEGKTTNRNVASITIEPLEMWGENLVVITVIGNAFLHSMVRTIVGTLVMVGRGKREPEWVEEVLEARNRTVAGENAPAQGLVLWKVNYDGELIYDPEAKRREQARHAEELARAAAKAEHKFRLFGGPLFGGAEFEIPRGMPRAEGELPFSGAALSDVKRCAPGDTNDFDPVEVDALRNPTNAAGCAEAESEFSEGVSGRAVEGYVFSTHAHAVSWVQTPAGILAETGMFGEIDWDCDLDEGEQPASRDYAQVTEPAVACATERGAACEAAAEGAAEVPGGMPFEVEPEAATATPGGAAPETPCGASMETCETATDEACETSCEASREVEPMSAREVAAEARITRPFDPNDVQDLLSQVIAEPVTQVISCDKVIEASEAAEAFVLQADAPTNAFRPVAPDVLTASEVEQAAPHCDDGSSSCSDSSASTEESPTSSSGGIEVSGKHATAPRKKRYPFEQRPLPYQFK